VPVHVRNIGVGTVENMILFKPSENQPYDSEKMKQIK
jgi:hypothetical protein